MALKQTYPSNNFTDSQMMLLFIVPHNVAYLVVTIAYFKPEICTDKINQKIILHIISIFCCLNVYELKWLRKIVKFTASGHLPLYATRHCYRQKLLSEHAHNKNE